MLPWRIRDFDAVLVDLDGTLVDTLDDFVAALQATLALLPPPFSDYRATREHVQHMIGKGSEHLVYSVLDAALAAAAATPGAAQRAAAPAVAADAAVRALAVKHYLEQYAQVNGRAATVYPGVREGLQQLRAAGLRLACVTNKPTVYARALLQSMDLAAAFELVVGGDATERKKPAADPLLWACQHMKLVPQRTLMVGDSSNDAQAARAAHCPVLLVTYGYNHGLDVRQADADAWVNRLDELDWAT